MIGFSNRIALAVSLLCLFAGASRASTFTIPDVQLSPSNFYYTDLIGGGIGSPLVMTGGGATANVGGSPNDDGFSGPIPLGFVFNLFGTDYAQFWANNNGIVSFTGGFPTWMPGGLSSSNVPIIAPFFADVDTTGAGSGLMYLRNDIPNEIIVTWDQVGYYRQHTDLLDSFQLVLRGPDFVSPAGEGQVGFFYKTMAFGKRVMRASGTEASAASLRRSASATVSAITKSFLSVHCRTVSQQPSATTTSGSIKARLQVFLTQHQ